MARKNDPSNTDLLEGMNKRFNMVFTELKKNDSRFDLMFRQLSSIKDEVRDIKDQQQADGEVLDEVRETLTAVAKAVDADAVTVLNHEVRIKKLEKAVAQK